VARRAPADTRFRDVESVVRYDEPASATSSPWLWILVILGVIVIALVVVVRFIWRRLRAR
jgi:uncharacterized membrane protein